MNGGLLVKIPERSFDVPCLAGQKRPDLKTGVGINPTPTRRSERDVGAAFMAARTRLETPFSSRVVAADGDGGLRSRWPCSSAGSCARPQGGSLSASAPNPGAWPAAHEVPPYG